jgi:hypothetical protein
VEDFMSGVYGLFCFVFCRARAPRAQIQIDDVVDAADDVDDGGVVCGMIWESWISLICLSKCWVVQTDQAAKRQAERHVPAPPAPS